jgi:hypothetical protein
MAANDRLVGILLQDWLASAALRTRARELLFERGGHRRDASFFLSAADIAAI